MMETEREKRDDWKHYMSRFYIQMDDTESTLDGKRKWEARENVSGFPDSNLMERKSQNVPYTDTDTHTLTPQ